MRRSAKPLCRAKMGKVEPVTNLNRMRARNKNRKKRSLSPISSSAWHLLGVTEYLEGHPEKAIDHIARAISIEPTRAEFHNDLAVAYGSLQRYDDALASLQRATQLNPEYFAALKNLGDLLRHKGSLDDALACYSRAMDLDSEDAELHYVIGDAYYRLSRLDE